MSLQLYGEHCLLEAQYLDSQTFWRRIMASTEHEGHHSLWTCRAGAIDGRFSCRLRSLRFHSLSSIHFEAKSGPNMLYHYAAELFVNQIYCKALLSAQMLELLLAFEYIALASIHCLQMVSSSSDLHCQSVFLWVFTLLAYLKSTCFVDF